jgi:hypothetical protein
MEIEVTLGSRDTLDNAQEAEDAQQLPDEGSVYGDDYGFYGFPWGSFFGW